MFYGRIYTVFKKEVLFLMQKHIRLKRSLIFFAIVSFIEYLIFHILYIAFDSLNEYVLLPVRLSVSLFPVLSAALVLRMHKTFKKSLLNILYLSSVRFVFSILYSYMFLVLMLHVKSIDALVIAPVAAIIMVALYALLTLLCYGLVRLVFNIKGIAFEPRKHFPVRVTDFKNPITTGLLILPLFVFAFELVFEIISTVSFFIDYGTVYRLDEIIWMIFSYLFLLLKLILTMLATKLAANKLLEIKKKEQTE